METDIVIIGAGAAGLMAAIAAGNLGAKTVIVEKMPRPGRKIMITGKGRCNMTNLKDWNEFSAHIHPKANFLKNSFFNFPPEKTVDFFRRNGLATVAERGDRVFPESHRAMDVVDTLTRAVSDAGVRIMTGMPVGRISGTDGHFTVYTENGEEIKCSKIIIATGGLSYPATGSTGDGYGWAERAGHRITPCFPSLTALVPSGYKILQDNTSGKGHIDKDLPLSELGRKLAGNALKNISLGVLIDGKHVIEEFGDIDFTDGGIEGPLGFKVSRKCVKALCNGSKVTLTLDLKPAVSQDALDRKISVLWESIQADSRSKGKNMSFRFRILLGKLMPVSLVDGFLRYYPDPDVRNLGKRLKCWKFEIPGFVGYERCVVTAGGVSTDDVSPRTMESRIVPGLYFAGEILDIDGDTGGYNLQAAFSTGVMAGEACAKSLLNLSSHHCHTTRQTGLE